jgi:hypothetical protein
MESKIYKIWSPKGDKIYIGSTTQKYLCNRMGGHRQGYQLWKNNETNLTSSYLLFNEYGVDSCEIELLELINSNDRKEINKIEGKYIKELNAINKNKAGQTKTEYYIENREKIVNNMKSKIPCNCGAICSKRNKARHLSSKIHLKYIDSINNNNNILLQ